jgi:DNA-binding LytR/AlgR family response regulator
MTTALVADDEILLRDYLQSKLQKLWPELEIIALTKNGPETAEKIRELEPDIAFLDIQMPGLSGLEVAQGIEGRTRVVFVTAFDEYAVQAFEREAVDYLLKPVTEERLARCLDRLKRSFAESSDPPANLARLLQQMMERNAEPKARLRWIRASRSQITYQIPVADVLYFQADDKYTLVHTLAGEHVIRRSLSELLQELDPSLFWQIHRSTVVNVDWIESTRRESSGAMFVTLRQQAGELAVSRAYMHLFKQM